MFTKQKHKPLNSQWKMISNMISSNMTPLALGEFLKCCKINHTMWPNLKDICKTFVSTRVSSTILNIFFPTQCQHLVALPLFHYVSKRCIYFMHWVSNIPQFVIYFFAIWDSLCVHSEYFSNKKCTLSTRWSKKVKCGTFAALLT